ncbi:MAG: hypothetical protein QXN68_05155 [Thermoplasmata archaeon]
MHPLNSPIMSEFMRYLLSHTKFEWNEETGNLVEVEKTEEEKRIHYLLFQLLMHDSVKCTVYSFNWRKKLKEREKHHQQKEEESTKDFQKFQGKTEIISLKSYRKKRKIKIRNFKSR